MMVEAETTNKASKVLPRALKNFESIKRYWDPAINIVVAKILPGEFYVTNKEEGITTVLGSCISACVRDTEARVGGMNHFMLPANKEDKLADLSAANRYGNYAMEALINEVLKNGGKRKNLEVKVVGGGRILEKMTNIGKMNIDFVRKYIEDESLALVGEDVGDIYPRKVIYLPYSGKVKVKRLRSLHTNTILERENNYLRSIETKDVGGEVELF